MSSIGLNEIFLILLVLLFAIGPKRIPDIARSTGRYIRYLRKAASEFRDAINIEELKKDLDTRELQKDIRTAVGDDLKSVQKDLKTSLDGVQKTASKPLDPPDDPEKPSGSRSGSLAG